jgi:hypothetical protein
MSEEVPGAGQHFRVELMKHEKEYMIGHYDIEFKAIGYLFTAHGAGLIASLSLLKDYATTPQLKGIGFFIVCFAVGFMFAALAFMTAQSNRATAMSVFLDGAPEKANITAMTMMGLVPQWISGATLMVAVGGIIYRFASL